MPAWIGAPDWAIEFATIPSRFVPLSASVPRSGSDASGTRL